MMMAPNPNQKSSLWSLLPTELLEIILQKIADISDFARFRCVCKSWRSAAKPFSLSPQLPWLLLPYDPTSSQRSFFSFSTRSICNLDLPETRNQKIYGSSNGWLLMLDQTLNISLFNPFTRSLIHLPQITTMPEHDGVRFVRDGDVYVRRFIVGSHPGTPITLEMTEDSFDWYAFVFSNSSSFNIDGVVVFTILFCPQIQYWRPGDEAWTVIDCGMVGFIQAMAFHKGKLYVINWDGKVAICDLGPAVKATVIPSLRLPDGVVGCIGHLVTSSEELLLITKDYSEEPIFEYHKLYENDGMMSWSKLQGVGGCTVFLTEALDTCLWKFMSVACNAPGHIRNCLCRSIPWKEPDREGFQPSRLDAILKGDGYQDLCASWETPPNLMSSSWIIPSLY